MMDSGLDPTEGIFFHLYRVDCLLVVGSGPIIASTWIESSQSMSLEVAHVAKGSNSLIHPSSHL